jgi:hypothetical protein
VEIGSALGGRKKEPKQKMALKDRIGVLECQIVISSALLRELVSPDARPVLTTVAYSH